MDDDGPVEAPRDPRLAWDLAPPGAMTVERDLDETCTRVVAPNASPMTLDGTNTYVIGAPGLGEAVVVDPGPDDPLHRARVDAVLTRRDAACTLVLVTHRHRDHAAAARAWSDDFGCPVAAPTAEVAGERGRIVRDGELVHAGGVRVEAVATPGHTRDHTSYRLGHGPLLTGDHVLGRGTSVVAHPDGDLVAYLASLRRVLALGPDALLPGHGPELTTDPAGVVAYYLDHRAFRERQLVAALESGPHDAPGLVRRIYAAVDPLLWPAAERSTRAGLAKLASEGRVESDAEGFFRLVR